MTLIGAPRLLRFIAVVTALPEAGQTARFFVGEDARAINDTGF